MRHKLLQPFCACALAAVMAVPAWAASQGSMALQRPAAKNDVLRVTLSLGNVGAGANAVLCKAGYNAKQLQLNSAYIVPGNGQSQTAARSTTLKTDSPGRVSAEWHDLDSTYTGGDFLVMEFTALADLTGTQITVSDVQLAAMQNGVAKTVSAQTASVQVSGGVTPGDVDLNGEVDTDDLLLLSRALVGLEDLPAMTCGADADGSGEIDTDDLLLLSRALAGLEEIPGLPDTFSCKLS